ncbi:MAG: 2-oxoacid:acceptor oxidoreductase family protein [Pirellula sp.]
MIRIRFHGRGGHGVKTASRIVGTAAFLAGYQCQDSPIYGAERRGAAVAAFARIDDHPILERGFIEHPDLIVLADETLLQDPTAGILAGLESAAAIFINCRTKETLISQHRIATQVVGYDVTQLTMDVLGVAVALSAGLGAAAARLCGLIHEEALLDAVRQECSDLGIGSDVICKNEQIARTVFQALLPIEFKRQQVRVPVSVDGCVVGVNYEGAFVGTPSVINPGNSEMRPTGDWRVERPQIDLDACTRCGLCYVMCPDAAIKLNPAGYPEIDYDHCKGCMICRQLCPLKAISTAEETQAW